MILFTAIYLRKNNITRGNADEAQPQVVQSMHSATLAALPAAVSPPGGAFYHSGGSVREITRWLKHVHASCALPSLTITQDAVETSETYQKENLHTSQRFVPGPTISAHYELSTPPVRTRALILQRLAEMIGGHELTNTLRTFPCSATNPLQVSGIKVFDMLKTHTYTI